MSGLDEPGEEPFIPEQRKDDIWKRWPTGRADWQPIETAPRDGTSFLAAIQVRQWNVARDACHEFWEMHVVRIDDETGDIDDDVNQGWGVTDYTHWMPLPPPPPEQKGRPAHETAKA